MVKVLHVLKLAVTLALVKNLVLASVKKGGAVGPRDYLCDDLKVMDKITWWYDWGSTLKEIEEKSGCHNVEQYKPSFIPMLWGKHSLENATIYKEAQYILGFNEPNHRKQSNLTAAQAAALWPQIENLGKGKMLVSPSASGCGGGSKMCHGDVIEWFDVFFRLCTGCRVDYIATHAYHCKADTTMNYLNTIYQRYGKKIWLTEFACPHVLNPDRELEYMRELLPRLEAAPFVFRYSWFVFRIRSNGSFVNEAASLFKPNTSELTPLGQYYNSFTGEQTLEEQSFLFQIILRVRRMFMTAKNILFG
ncbi:hypothetical protein ACF0H5_016686 [Mactra antiquata]